MNFGYCEEDRRLVSLAQPDTHQPAFAIALASGFRAAPPNIGR